MLAKIYSILTSRRTWLAYRLLDHNLLTFFKRVIRENKFTVTQLL
jgi:hypothetical protein